MNVVFSRTLLLALLTSPLASASSGEKLRFVVLGHLRGDANGEQLANLQEVVEAVRREDPDLVFLCGDLIWGDIHREGRGDPAVIRADWERLDAALAGVGAPVHRVPGNHDICDLATRDVWRERYGVLPRSFDSGNARFLLLESGWVPEDGDMRRHPQDKIRGVPLDAGQIAFVRAELEPDASIEHVFVLMHHLLWWEEEAPWWEDVAPVFDGHPVRAVFSGDYGPLKFSHQVRDGVEYFQTSIENRISTEMLRGNEASRTLSAQFDNYLVVDVDGADVRYDVRTVGALTSGKFSPARFREIYEYDKGSVGRKLSTRWSTPERLTRGLWQISLVAFGAGVACVLAFALLRRLMSRNRA
ncbi:MAG TPA: metallophosphoesterase [Planctomycetota bacterium]|nr:metallophosphoesterase [Planctomycetota bacterium]